ncbi:MAG: hypothetical protein NT154_13440 [Verrucomicrobia bacterium]|nr:hypothetical protein [Verrucomicrobiota bacterium]
MNEIPHEALDLSYVWRESDGTVRRHCLLKHAIKGLARRLGRRYESLFEFPLIDHTLGISGPEVVRIRSKR